MPQKDLAIVSSASKVRPAVRAEQALRATLYRRKMLGISCHARASVNGQGTPAQGFGFMEPPERTSSNCPPTGRCSPNGTPDPNWFWGNLGSGEPDLKALQTDFLFSLVLHAIGPAEAP
jgi:hypothetical protein